MKHLDQKIEHEVEKTLDVLDQIDRVAGNPYLYSRIKERLVEPSKVVSVGLRWSITLATLLFLLNFLTVRNYLKTQNTQAMTDLATEYGFDNEFSSIE